MPPTGSKSVTYAPKSTNVHTYAYISRNMSPKVPNIIKLPSYIHITLHVTPYAPIGIHVPPYANTRSNVAI